MIVISDTNILSSLAAANSLYLLPKAFPRSQIYIPTAVQAELQIGASRGKSHLQAVLTQIDSHEIGVLTLTEAEQQLSQTLPVKKLKTGEREGIILSQKHHALFLSNDQRAVRYCREQQVRVIDLSNLLRLFWTQQLISQPKVRQLIEQMTEVENLVITPSQLSEIFGKRNPAAKG